MLLLLENVVKVNSNGSIFVFFGPIELGNIKIKYKAGKQIIRVNLSLYTSNDLARFAKVNQTTFYSMSTLKNEVE